VENSNSHPQLSRWLEHIRSLAMDIGPRGSTRPGERQAADYAMGQFKQFGLEPILEKFQSARSIFQPHLLGSILMILAFIIFPLSGKFSATFAAALAILVLITEILELGLQSNLFRWVMPKSESQNAYAVIQPSSEHTHDLILVGHLDTQRTPIIFKSTTWVRIYGAFTTVVFVAFFFEALIYSLAVFFPLPWAWVATIPSLVGALLLAAMCIQADLTPFTAGANDNASAVGMVLTLAEEFSKKPMAHARVFAVCTGCEEVQHYGMIDFYKRHKDEFKNPQAVVFEMLGCAGPTWLTQEGIIVPFKPDEKLRKIAEKLAAENPTWGAYPSKVSGGNTEMADAVRAGVPAIALMGMTLNGEAPYWHQVHDTFDKMDPQIMLKNWEFTKAFLSELDI
jgi:hypothetical protein